MDAEELREARKRAPIGGLFDVPPDLPAVVPETRHAAAQARLEGSATPRETTIVKRVQARLREMPEWDADTVRDLLNDEGVPDKLEVRRRYASRCVNGISDKRKLGTRMTRHQARSGRPITIWSCWPDPDDIPFG